MVCIRSWLCKFLLICSTSQLSSWEGDFPYSGQPPHSCTGWEAANCPDVKCEAALWLPQVWRIQRVRRYTHDIACCTYTNRTCLHEQCSSFTCPVLWGVTIHLSTLILQVHDKLCVLWTSYQKSQVCYPEIMCIAEPDSSNQSST